MGAYNNMHLQSILSRYLLKFVCIKISYSHALLHKLPVKILITTEKKTPIIISHVCSRNKKFHFHAFFFYRTYL